MKNLIKLCCILLIGFVTACGPCGCKPEPNKLSVTTIARGHNFTVEDDFNVYKLGDSVLISFETHIIDDSRSVRLLYPVTILRDTSYLVGGKPHGQSVAVVTKVINPNKKTKR